jgi:hypothetical protein
MSVLKRMQFAEAPDGGFADGAIIGAGTVECQSRLRRIRLEPCFTGAR